MMKRNIIVCFVMLAFVSCNKDDVSLNVDDEVINDWLSANNISASRDDNGIYYFPDSLSGLNVKASTGDVVSIYYDMTDLDGFTIDRHLPSDGDSISFKYASSAVYPIGLDNAISQMNLGDSYTFILPTSQAYASLRSGAISSDLIVKISIKLVNIQEESEVFDAEITSINAHITNNNLNDTIANPTDSVIFYPATQLFYKRTFRGNGNAPINGQTVIFDFEGSFMKSGEILSSQENFSYEIGSGQPRSLISGLENALSLMQVNERAMFLMTSEIAYRESALIIPSSIADDLFSQGIVPQYAISIPPYATLIFNLTRDN